MGESRDRSSQHILLIPVPVTGIQSTRVRAAREFFQPKDLGWLDFCYELRNEGSIMFSLAVYPDKMHLLYMKGYVYILASKRNGTLYTGVTKNLSNRLFEHQNELTPGFTSQYGVKTLVWFEEYDLLTSAITREKTIKKWPRQWKLNLIERTNPEWNDVSSHLHDL
jgi:putative endonuclease